MGLVLRVWHRAAVGSAACLSWLGQGSTGQLLTHKAVCALLLLLCCTALGCVVLHTGAALFIKPPVISANSSAWAAFGNFLQLAAAGQEGLQQQLAGGGLQAYTPPPELD